MIKDLKLRKQIMEQNYVIRENVYYLHMMVGH